jgi:hypothetical protein
MRDTYAVMDSGSGYRGRLHFPYGRPIRLAVCDI